MTTSDRNTGYTPALLLGDESMQLLANAEALVYETECSNRCAHFEEGRFSNECPHFKAARNGYIACDGYAQAGEGAAA